MGGMGMGGMGMAGAGMGGMGIGGGMGGRGGRGGQWNWQWPGGAASAWAGPTFEAMMQGWMGEHPQQPGAARDSAAGDHVMHMLRPKPQQQMPMRPPTPRLRQQQRML